MYDRGGSDRVDCTGHLDGEDVTHRADDVDVVDDADNADSIRGKNHISDTNKTAHMAIIAWVPKEAE